MIKDAANKATAWALQKGVSGATRMSRISQLFGGDTSNLPTIMRDVGAKYNTDVAPRIEQMLDTDQATIKRILRGNGSLISKDPQPARAYRQPRQDYYDKPAVSRPISFKEMYEREGKPVPSQIYFERGTNEHSAERAVKYLNSSYSRLDHAVKPGNEVPSFKGIMVHHSEQPFEGAHPRTKGYAARAAGILMGGKPARVTGSIDPKYIYTSGSATTPYEANIPERYFKHMQEAKIEKLGGINASAIKKFLWRDFPGIKINNGLLSAKYTRPGYSPAPQDIAPGMIHAAINQAEPFKKWQIGVNQVGMPGPKTLAAAMLGTAALGTLGYQSLADMSKPKDERTSIRTKVHTMTGKEALPALAGAGLGGGVVLHRLLKGVNLMGAQIIPAAPSIPAAIAASVAAGALYTMWRTDPNERHRVVKAVLRHAPNPHVYVDTIKDLFGPPEVPVMKAAAIAQQTLTKKIKELNEHASLLGTFNPAAPKTIADERRIEVLQRIMPRSEEDVLEEEQKGLIEDQTKFDRDMAERKMKVEERKASTSTKKTARENQVNNHLTKFASEMDARTQGFMEKGAALVDERSGSKAKKSPEGKLLFQTRRDPRDGKMTFYFPGVGE